MKLVSYFHTFFLLALALICFRLPNPNRSLRKLRSRRINHNKLVHRNETDSILLPGLIYLREESDESCDHQSLITAITFKF